MENPRPTPLEQRNELYVALQKGDLNDVKPDISLSSVQVHY